jgi:hypothetical protein
MNNFNDLISGELSDYLSISTRTFFEQQRDELEQKRKVEIAWQNYLKDKREKLVNQACELGLLDSLESEFLEDDTIADLINDYKYYLANPAE